jgi:predicted amidophosphoribosyltransferase
MPRFSLPDALRAWIDPDILGLTELPLPRALGAAMGRCAVCGAWTDGGGSDPVSRDGCERPDGVDAVISLGDYDGPAGHAARLIKGTCWADGAWWWGRALGERLLAWSACEHNAGTGIGFGGVSTRTMVKDAVLVPVPGDPWRTLVRGIDHAGALARAASVACGWPSRSLLVRHDRVRQASRRAQQRRSLHGRFALRSKIMTVPEQVVLVDDVCTTGSTGADCAHAIRRAGASWVALGVLARAHR